MVTGQHGVGPRLADGLWWWNGRQWISPERAPAQQARPSAAATRQAPAQPAGQPDAAPGRLPHQSPRFWIVTVSIVAALALLSVCITAAASRPGSLTARHAATATKPTPGVSDSTPALAPGPIVSPTTSANPSATAPAAGAPGSAAASAGHRRAAAASAAPPGAASVPTQQQPPVPPAVPDTCGAPPNPWGYNFCGGSLIYDPDPAFCDYFDCVLGFWAEDGYVEQCADGLFGHQGFCSFHGGNDRALLH